MRKAEGCLLIKVDLGELKELKKGPEVFKVKKYGFIKHRLLGERLKLPLDFETVKFWKSTRKFVEFDFEGLDREGKNLIIHLGDQL